MDFQPLHKPKCLFILYLSQFIQDNHGFQSPVLVKICSEACYSLRHWPFGFLVKILVFYIAEDGGDKMLVALWEERRKQGKVRV